MNRNLPTKAQPTYNLSNPSLSLNWGGLLPDIQNWAIGFERQWNMLENLRSMSGANNLSYPPYNILKVDDNNYEIHLAVAGFSKKDIEVVLQEQVLTISGNKPDTEEKHFIHKGIGARNFKHTFALADHVEVKSASFEDGILTISLEREVPEEKKARVIKIG